MVLMGILLAPYRHWASIYIYVSPYEVGSVVCCMLPSRSDIAASRRPAIRDQQ